MTLTTLIPELDDIAFDRLVEDGRGFIPRYAPDWTDHNLHDPGITLIDLIAFLVDNQVYRIGIVGDSLRRAFTGLMGVTEDGPEGAKMLIWPTAASVPLDMEAGTVIDSPDLPDAAFTLDEDVRMIPEKLDKLALVTGDTEKDLGKGLLEGRDPITIWPHSGGGPRSLEVQLDGAVQHQDNGGYMSLGVSLRDPPSDDGPDWDGLTVEQHDPAGFWRPVVVKDLTRGLRQTGPILFKPHPAALLQRLRLRLDQGFRPAGVTIDKLALNVLPATEGRDFGADAVLPLGEGTGFPGQEVILETDDIIDRDKVEIFSLDADGRQLWTLVPSFENSGPADAHMVRTETGLRFGNGLNGMVVPKGASVRIGRHRRTCGTHGAVARGLIWRAKRAGAVLGTNIAASGPGKDRDQLADLIRKARGAAKGRAGLLRSEKAVEQLAATALGLGNVRVVPLRRPGLDDVEVPGNRTILVIPGRDPGTPPPPPDLRLSSAVAALLDPGRPLGEHLHVSLPVYRRIDVSIALLLEGDADGAVVKQEAEALIRQRFWDLPRDADQAIAPWQPGRPVTTDEIAALMASLASVLRVTDCRIGQGGTPGTDPIVLTDREIALADRVTVAVTRIEEGASP